MPGLAHLPILFAIAAAVPWLALPEPAGPCRGQDPDPDAAATCGMCHKDFYQEWKGRAHANSWTDPIYQAAIAKVKSPEACHNCHIPQQVLKKLGRKPDVRTDRRDEGVTCVACHKSGDKIHGPFGAQTDAHPGEKDPAFQSGSTHLCASCHSTKIGPVLPVARDFLEAKMEEKGKSCVGCHMPEIERHLAISPATGKPTGEKRKTRDHRVLGPGDPDYCAKAFALAAVKDGKDAVLSVRNEAGHRVPGLMLREFVFRVRQLDAAGKDLANGSVTLSHENELRATETREFRFALAAGAATLAVEVDHVFQAKVVATVRKETLPL